MSILGVNRTSNNSSSSSSSISGNSNMGTSGMFFHEFKKQASFYVKEKIKTARLALTDVTPTQLLTEEATDANPTAPDAQTMGFISRSAFEVDDFERIVEILHKKLSKFDRKEWRPSYKALVLLEHLLTHGPESVAGEFQCNRQTIKEMLYFQHVDERGFNWGSSVRKKSERVLKLLESQPLLKEERDRARKISRGIKGFGSLKTATGHRILEESPGEDKTFRKSHSHFNEHGNEEDDDENIENPDEVFKKTAAEQLEMDTVTEDDGAYGTKHSGTRASVKENMAPKVHSWKRTKESKPLLIVGGTESGHDEIEEEHPFNQKEKQNCLSLLTASEEF